MNRWLCGGGGRPGCGGGGYRGGGGRCLSEAHICDGEHRITGVYECWRGGRSGVEGLHVVKTRVGQELLEVLELLL